MPGRDRFVFKPPHFPRFDSIVPSAIFQGDSPKLYYLRWLIHAVFAILFIVTCGLFGSTIVARVVFANNVHECMGTLGEINNSNDHSVTVVIPQIAMAIFILTFMVVFISYNVLVQFLIVLTILEGVTFLVWKYQFPIGSVELDKEHFIRIVTRRMIKCHVITNRTVIEPCWEQFMADYCQEWAATEMRLCPTSTTTVTPSTTSIGGNVAVGDASSPVMTNIHNCYKRFMMHPWSNVTREEQYMEILAPHVTTLMSLHVISVILLYLAARLYVREYRRLRDNWIMELQTYYTKLTTAEDVKDSFLELCVPWSRLIDKHIIWEPARCAVCKDDPDSSHCRLWIMFPGEEFPLPTTVLPYRPLADYWSVGDSGGVANGDGLRSVDSTV